MAKGIYVGVDSKARKVKKVYVGAVDDNLVVNGDFNNELEGWSISELKYHTATIESDSEGNYVKVVHTTSHTSNSRGFVRSTKYPTYANHVYYMCAIVKNGANNSGTVPTPRLSASMTDTGSLITATNSSEWHLLSGIFTRTIDVASDSLILDSWAEKNTTGNEFYFRNVKMYDLTAMYGSGNEPAKDWCDANLATLKAGSVARKVKKGYIGVGGIARLFYSSGPELNYYGTTTPLSVARSSSAGVSVGNYGLIGGGYTGSSYSAVVDAYDTNLTRSTPTVLSVARRDLVGTLAGSYGLFGGGYTGSYSAVVDAYNANLTRSTPTALSIARRYLEGVSVGDYGLFGGGIASSSSNGNVVDAYNANLTRSTPTVLSVSRHQLAGVSVGNYGLFGGGYTGSSYTAVVNAYNTGLVRSTPTALSVSRRNLEGISVGNYGLFGGGAGSSNSNVVDAYDTNLTKSTPAALSQARTTLATVSVGGYGLFGGGYTSNRSAVVDAYDINLTRSTATPLSVARSGSTGVSVGGYGLFGGGYAESGYSDVVDVYQYV